MLFTERLHFAQEIVADVVPVDDVIVIADHTDLKNHVNLRAQFFAEFTPDCHIQVLPFLHTASGSLDHCRLAEHVIAFGADEIEVSFFIENDASGDPPVMVNVF